MYYLVLFRLAIVRNSTIEIISLESANESKFNIADLVEHGLSIWMFIQILKLVTSLIAANSNAIAKLSQTAIKALQFLVPCCKER